ncbi:MAG: hypothetical protein V4617_11350 [Gemmatimonadota bacterium]
MFSTCVHCQQSLDRNESIERFPIGRRIAFDGARGRLWAVCGKCERWNLSPIEERWEAIEECERAFRDTRVRVSTDNIGLARLREGTELVRIGKPMRPEFAAWRYGDQFGRRRKRIALYAAGGTVAMGALVAGGMAAGVSLLAATNLSHLIQAANVYLLKRQLQFLLPLPDGTWLNPVATPHLVARPEVDERWGIQVRAYRFEDRPLQVKKPLLPGKWIKRDKRHNYELVDLRGNDAQSVMRWALPRVNRMGASHARVAESVRVIEQAGAPADFGSWIATQLPAWRAKQRFVDDGALDGIPKAVRLAFEMSMHEETERRALEGELHLLEAAWRDADAIAKIADSMFVPQQVDERITQLRAHSQDAALVKPTHGDVT